MPYDQRIMRLHGLDQGSFLTRAGRVLVALLVGTYYQECCDTRASGQCHLIMLRDEAQWFLLVVVQVPDGTLFPPTDFLGIDLGVVHLATTSTHGEANYAA